MGSIINIPDVNNGKETGYQSLEFRDKRPAHPACLFSLFIHALKTFKCDTVLTQFRFRLTKGSYTG